jgi:hypothetical protein
MEAAQSLRNRLSVKHFLLRNRVEFPILRGGDQEAEKAVRGTHRDERSETSMSTGVHLMGGNGKQPSKQPASHDALIEAIAKGERLLVRLEGEQQDARARLVRDTGFKTTGGDGAPTIRELYAALAADEKRNWLILDDVIQALEEGRSPILLTERKDHLEYFAARLEKFARHLVVLQGGMSAKERRGVKAKLAAIPDDEERLVLATGRYIGEGFDDARPDTLFLALPVFWKGTLIQYTGRLYRLHSGKTEVRIFDYVDREVPMLSRMFEKRLRGYRVIGYAKGETPLGYGETGDEVVVEYDEDVLRSLKELDDFT